MFILLVISGLNLVSVSLKIFFGWTFGLFNAFGVNLTTEGVPEEISMTLRSRSSSGSESGMFDFSDYTEIKSSKLGASFSSSSSADWDESAGLSYIRSALVKAFAEEKKERR